MKERATQQVSEALLAAEARVRELEALVAWHTKEDSFLRSKLAAANALLERWYRDYAKQSNLSRETKGHLSAQPAAPCGSTHRLGHCPQCVDRGDQPAAPGSVLSDGTWIRTPEEERGRRAAPTDHDRAVLEATDGIPEYTLSFWARCGSDVWMPFGKAVLARREAKR